MLNAYRNVVLAAGAALLLGAASAQGTSTFTFDITVPNVAAIAAEAGTLPFTINQEIPAFAQAWAQTGIPAGGDSNQFRMRYAYNKTAVAAGQQFHGLASISGAMSFLDAGSTGTGLNAAEALDGAVFTLANDGVCQGVATANSFTVGSAVPVSWYDTVRVAAVGAPQTAVFTVGSGSATLNATQPQFIGSANVGALGNDLALVDGGAAVAAPAAAEAVTSAIRGAVCGVAAGEGVTFNLAVTEVPTVVPAGTYRAQLVLTMAEKNTWTLAGIVAGPATDGTPTN